MDCESSSRICLKPVTHRLTIRSLDTGSRYYCTLHALMRVSELRADESVELLATDSSEIGNVSTH